MPEAFHSGGVSAFQLPNVVDRYLAGSRCPYIVAERPMPPFRAVTDHPSSIHDSFEATVSFVSPRVRVLSEPGDRVTSMGYSNFAAIVLAMRRARPSLDDIH